MAFALFRITGLCHCSLSPPASLLAGSRLCPGEALGPASPSGPAGLAGTLEEGRNRIRDRTAFLFPVALPPYLTTQVQRQAGVVSYLARFLGPVMGVRRLPAEAAAVLSVGRVDLSA